MEGHIFHKNKLGFAETTRYAGAIPAKQGDELTSFYDEPVTFFNLAPSHHDDGQQYAFVEGKLTVMTLEVAHALASTALTQFIRTVSNQTGTDAHAEDSIESATPLAMLIQVATTAGLYQSDLADAGADIKDAYNDWTVFADFTLFLDSMERPQVPTSALRKTCMAARALLTLHMTEELGGGFDAATASNLPIYTFEDSEQSEPTYHADYSRASRLLRGLC